MSEESEYCISITFSWDKFQHTRFGNYFPTATDSHINPPSYFSVRELRGNIDAWHSQHADKTQISLRFIHLVHAEHLLQY